MNELCLILVDKSKSISQQCNIVLISAFFFERAKFGAYIHETKQNKQFSGMPIFNIVPIPEVFTGIPILDSHGKRDEKIRKRIVPAGH